MKHRREVHAERGVAEVFLTITSCCSLSHALRLVHVPKGAIVAGRCRAVHSLRLGLMG